MGRRWRAGYGGKTMFITGVASGMGLLAARTLAGAGARVVGFARGRLEQTESAIRAGAGADARVCLYACDVTDRAQTLAALGRAARECGAPDVVLHMAGVGGVAPLADMPFETFDQIMRTNVYGTRHVVEAMLPHMRASAGRARPCIVLAGSLGGFVPVYGYTAYGASKFAVVGLAACLRYELAPHGIDVCCFCPGQVDTPGLRGEREHTHPATEALKWVGGTMSGQAAVDGLLRGVLRRDSLIVPGWRSRLLLLALRLTPRGVWNLVTDHLVARALRGARR